MAEYAPLLAPFTFADFEAAWCDACVKAWDDGHREPRAVLPEGVLPHVAKLVNPVTRDLVTVERVPMFPWPQPVEYLHVTYPPGEAGTVIPIYEHPPENGRCVFSDSPPERSDG